MNPRQMEIKTTKAMGLIYLSQAISDFRNFPIQVDDESNRIFMITVHGIKAEGWKYIITEIYYQIENIIFNGKQEDWHMKAAMIASLDYEGSRTSDLNERLSLHPHIHALVILPYATNKDAKELEYQLNTKIIDIKHDVIVAMEKKGASDGYPFDGKLWKFAICVDPFFKKKKVCFLSAISYQIKATSFLDFDSKFLPVVYPYELKLKKYQQQDKMAKIVLAKDSTHRMLQDLIFDPNKYFSGNLFEIDSSHEFFLHYYYRMPDCPDDILQQLKSRAIYFIENNMWDRLFGSALQLKYYINDIKNELKKGNLNERKTSNAQW